MTFLLEFFPNRKKKKKVMLKSDKIRNLFEGFGDLWAVGPPGVPRSFRDAYQTLNYGIRQYCSEWACFWGVCFIESLFVALVCAHVHLFLGILQHENVLLGRLFHWVTFCCFGLRPQVHCPVPRGFGQMLILSVAVKSCQIERTFIFF